MNNGKAEPRPTGRVRFAVGGLASILLLAAACGSDDPDKTTTTTETTETAQDASERSVYGVDLSGLDLPSADPYDGYETYEDDTGQVEIVAPTDWDDVNTSEGERDDESLPGVWASTDLEALQSGFTVPGLQVDLRTGSSENDLLELLNSDNATAEQCSGPETFDYDDGLYTGTAELWTDCSDDGAALLQLVALRDGNQYVTLEIQMLTDADIDAAIAALQGMLATEVDSGTTTTETQPSGTADEPGTTADDRKKAT